MSRVWYNTPMGSGTVNRVAPPSPSGGKGDIGRKADIYCKGKNCTLWRWGHIISDPEGELTAEDVGANPNKFSPSARFKPRKGYCGLGGKPKD